jgi:hypothetical protein
MGLTPATGTEIAMSCVYDAFGFPLPTFNISLNGVLGALRQPPQALGVSAIPASSQTTLSSDMGGLTTIDDYNCSDTFTTLILGTSNGVSGFTSDTNFCTGNTISRFVYVPQSGITSFQEAAITYGLPLYSATTFINANKYNGGNQWYGSISKSEVFQVNSDGAMSLFGVCASPTPTPSVTPPSTPASTPASTSTPTQTQTPTNTPTNTASQTSTPTQTGTAVVPSISATPTNTATPSVTPLFTIYTHGLVRATCSDYCTTNYNITTLTSASNTYLDLTIGNFIYGISGAGFIAYSNVSTDTTTGPFRIAEIDSSGEVLSIQVCVANSCEIL